MVSLCNFKLNISFCLVCVGVFFSLGNMLPSLIFHQPGSKTKPEKNGPANRVQSYHQTIIIIIIPGPWEPFALFSYEIMHETFNFSLLL